MNVDYYFDEYYINKYENFDMDEEIKENMGLCIENNCFNISEIGEDLCYYCIKAQETTEEEIININLDKYINYYMENLVNNCINEVIKEEINKSNYSKDLIYIEKNNKLKIVFDKNIYKYLDDYKNNILLKYLYKLYNTNFINIFNVLIKYNNNNTQKPNIIISPFKGKVKYLDFKIQVYKFPISDSNIYNHIYDKYILYYKHVCNDDLNKRNIEPYLAYICYIQDGKQEFDTISFIKLFEILNLIYNKKSIINHIYDITYRQFDITKLLK